MTSIIENANKSLPLPVRNQQALPKELIDLKKQAQKEWVIKSLFASAVLAMGICAIILLNSNFLAVGVALIMVSSLAIYQYSNHYRHSRNIFLRAAAAISQTYKK